jgi:crotonobetaine/carnitine-CoA ligase
MTAPGGSVTQNFPDLTASVLPLVVQSWADKEPDRPFLRQIDGPSLSYREGHELALLWAAVFCRFGVGAGDRVLVMRKPHVDGVAMWLGQGWLGAVDTSINTDYRGAMLEYVLGNAAPRLLVVADEFLPRFAELGDKLAAELVVLVPDADRPSTSLPCRVVGRAEAFDGLRPEPPSYRPGPWDAACVIYTSGTTGPSKGVIVPWAQIHATATGCFPPELLGDDEVFYSPFTMFHMSGKLPPVVVGTCGGQLVVRETLSITALWDDIRTTRSTMTIGSGVMTDLIMREPPNATDKDLCLRWLLAGPASPSVKAFGERFGVQVGTAFNMTEISVALMSGWGLSNMASCGRLREGYPGYDVRIVDEHDREVPTGDVGELVVRTSTPWTINSGYLGYPEKTAEAWRNGWFHTGDAMRVDENGDYYFVDRIQDAIRRRGENISSFEVETAVLAHPDVAEAAAVAVPDSASGQEVKIFVVRTPQSALSEQQLVEWLIPRMPRFMVPRYVELVTDLPRTEASLKIKKAQLRKRPLTDATWDREAAGIEVPR